MRRRKRNATQTPLSLFAFQDLITSLCGIMVLLALVMALNVAASWALPGAPVLNGAPSLGALSEKMSCDANAAPPGVTATFSVHSAENDEQEEEQAEHRLLAQRRDALETELAGLVAENEKFRESLAQAYSQRTEAYATPEPPRPMIPVRFVHDGALPGHTLLVECSARGIVVAEAETGKRIGQWPLNKAYGFSFGSSHVVGSSRAHIVFLVKPCGIDLFHWLRRQAQMRGHSIGYDALAADETIARSER